MVGVVALDLLERAIEHAQRLLGFEAAGIVVLGHEDGKEQRAEAALFGARQVELAVGLALADIAAVIELAVDGVDVAVEDERAGVQGARAVETPAGAQQSRPQRTGMRPLHIIET